MKEHFQGYTLRYEDNIAYLVLFKEGCMTYGDTTDLPYQTRQLFSGYMENGEVQLYTDGMYNLLM